MSFFKSYLKYDAVAAVEFLSCVVFLLPRIRVFNFFKSLYLRVMFGATIGRRVVFYPGVWIFTGRKLVLGDDVDLAKGVLITTSGGVEIGDRVLVGYDAKIISSNHMVPPVPEKIFSAGHDNKKVVIEKDSWIGANSIILPGVRIGEGAVVAAGSIVTRDVPPFCYVGGVPAKKIKERL